MILSIIIPVYKSEKTIRQCVDSAIRNVPDKSEIILVDDGSPDNCPQICDEYAEKDSRIKVIHKENGGLSSARNCGLEIASGEYVFFLDSDDYVLDGYFDKMLSHNADLIISNFVAFYPDGAPDFTINLPDIKAYSINEFIANFNIFFGTIFNFAWGKIYKREIIDGLRFVNGLSMAEDVLFNVEYYSKIQTVIIEKDAVVRYRQSSSSLSKQYNDKLFDWYLLSYEKVKKLLEDRDLYAKNESHFVNCFMNNIGECIRGIFNKNKIDRNIKLLEICNNELVVDIAEKYQPKTFLMKGISAFIKNKKVNKLILHLRTYNFLASIKHIGGRVIKRK